MKRYTLGVTMLMAVLGMLAVAGLAISAAAQERQPQKDAPAATEATTTEAEVVEAPPLTLEERLANIMEALGTYTTKKSHVIPSSTEALADYIKEGKKGLVNPETNKPIIMNAELKDKDDRGITEPEKLITFYADKETADKGLAVVFGDGKVKYLTQEELKKTLESVKVAKLSKKQLQDLSSDKFDRAGDIKGARRQRSGK